MTYNIEFTDKPDRRGFHHLMIRLHQKGQKPARIQLDIEYETRYLSQTMKWGKWIKASHLHADTENTRIIAAYKKVRDAIALLLEAGLITPAQAKLRYESTRLTLLRDYEPEKLVNPALAHTTRQAKIYTWNAFLKWAGNDLSLEQLNVNMLERYVGHLLAEKRRPSTINEYMSDLREMYSAIQRARGIPKREILAHSPFVDWQRLKATTRKKGRLHQEGIKQLSAPGFDLTVRRENGRLDKRAVDWSRWCWLAAHYQAGMRIGDLLRSRYEWYQRGADGFPVRLQYQMQKNGRSISIPLSKATIAHLSLIWRTDAPEHEYVLPYLDNQAAYASYRTYEQIKAMPGVHAEVLQRRIATVITQLNRGLKLAVKELEIKVIGGGSLSNHTARHSFADKVRLAIKSGKLDAKGRPLTNFDAKDLLGHSFMSTTEVYFGEMDQEMLDSAMDALFGGD